MKKMHLLIVVLAVLMIPVITFGAALTANRDTDKRSGERLNIGVYTNTRIWAGSMVAVTRDGYAVPASDTAGYKVIGRAEEMVDNRIAVGDGYSGALNIEVRRGVFAWLNHSAMTDTNIGDFAFVVDDQSVSETTPANSVIAGIVVDVSGSNVWVDTYSVPRTAGAFVTLTASGATTLSSTLAVAGVGTFSTNVTIAGSATVATTLGVTGVTTLSTNATVAGTLGVNAKATFSDTIHLTELVSGVYTGKTEVVTNIINTTYTQVTTYVDGLYISETTDP